MGNEVVNRRLNIYIDQAGAEQSIERLTKKENELVASIEKAKKAGKDFSKEMQQLASTRTQIGQIKDVIDGKVLPSLKMAEAAVGSLRRELKRLPADSEAALKKLQELKKAEQTLVQVKNAVYGVDKALDGIKKDRGIGRIMDNAFSVFLGGGLLGAVTQLTSAFGAFFSDSISEAIDAEKATARLQATLNNLGRDDVFGRLSQSANDFAQSFKFIDNDDVIGVFEQLITYGKLTEKQITDLTPVIIDFAAKSQISLSDSASTIIKALEGNGKALKEYGIEVTGAKNETEAFNIIMDQLKPKVEGAAEAFGQTTAGQIAITRQEIANLKEDIGTQLLPVVKEFYQAVSDILSSTKQLFNSEAISGWEKFKFIITGAKDATVLLKLLQEQQRKIPPAPLAPGEEAYRRSLDGDPISRGVIGLGSILSPAEIEALRREAELIKKQLDEINKKYKEFSTTIKGEALDIEMGEIFAAFRKINEEAAKDIATLQEFQKKGLVTSVEAEELTTAINVILEKQREVLQEKFKLNPIKIPIAIDNSFKDTNSDAESFSKKIFSDLEKGLKSQGRNEFAALELDFLKSSGKKKLNEYKLLLDAEKDQEISNKNLTQNEILVIEEKYRQLKLEAEKSYWIDVADIALTFATQVADISNSINQIRTNNENAALEKEIFNNDERRKSFKKLLDNKVINQKEYDRRISALDAQQEARETDLRKKQFQQDKNAQTVQALISGAQAVLSTLSRFGAPIPPNFLGIGAMALTVATTAASIAAIRSAKPPQFEKGGFIPQGSSHRQGGISLIDNRTGANVGEVEGGEPIISRKVYARNKPAIDAMLNPAWANAAYQPMNIPRLNSSMAMRYFADGGILPQPGQGDNSNMALMNMLRQLNEKLSQPLYSQVIYGEYELKANKVNGIRNAGVIR